VKSEAAVTADESAEDSAAANSQFDGNGSLFRDGPGAIKTEDHATEDLPFTEKGQKILNEELNGSFTHGIAA